MKGRVLLFSYAFPPTQVQMTPAVVKAMAAFSRHGYEVDVLCAAPFSPFFRRDESLIPYAERHFRKVTRLGPSKGLVSKLRQRSHLLSLFPDPMTILQGPAFDMLMSMDLKQYAAIVTWSPFHSINPVMVRLKRHRRWVKWLAQFSDPWASNPLEWSRLTKLWNWWHEPNTVRTADFIVHSSPNSRDLMMNGHAPELLHKTEIIPHPFDKDLYPARPKVRNDRITLRHIGVLFGRRSPEPLFQALNCLFEKRPELAEEILVELVGPVPPEMLHTSAAQSLPAGTIKHVASLPYLESLEKMYDADVLLLIEADTKHNLFVPSKLSDYMGARSPIVGIVPPGGSEDILKGLGRWHAHPNDIDGIALAVEAAIDYVASGSQEPWCDEDYRQGFSNDLIAGRFVNILKRMDRQ
jgi:glycosyltransferase involved in cell wall biosynthesis